MIHRIEALTCCLIMFVSGLCVGHGLTEDSWVKSAVEAGTGHWTIDESTGIRKFQWKDELDNKQQEESVKHE